jgi:Rrf2 family protein
MHSILQISEAANLAVHALAYLVSRPEGQRHSASALAQALGVSESHLGKVLQRLARLGWLDSIRGARGGFASRPGAGERSLLEVVEAIDGGLAESGCLLGTPICGQARCALIQVREQLASVLRAQLSALRVHDLVARPPQPRVPGGPASVPESSSTPEGGKGAAHVLLPV